MELKVIKNEKEAIDLEVSSISIAEILRVYLNKDSNVEFVAWRREHPTKNPLLKVETKGKTASKAIKDAVSMIEKDLDKLSKDFEKLK
jgi:DNA-directed RNA polymerase subunit L